MLISKNAKAAQMPFFMVSPKQSRKLRPKKPKSKDEESACTESTGSNGNMLLVSDFFFDRTLF